MNYSQHRIELRRAHAGWEARVRRQIMTPDLPTGAFYAGRALWRPTRDWALRAAMAEVDRLNRRRDREEEVETILYPGEADV